MFDKLDDLLVRFEELLNELGEPGVTDDPAHFQKLMKEQSDLQPIVDAYKEYKKNKETIEDSLSMLESEKDEEMREMLKEELSDARKRVEELEHELKILLLPRDPNDEKTNAALLCADRGGAVRFRRFSALQRIGDLRPGRPAAYFGEFRQRARPGAQAACARRGDRPQRGNLRNI